VMIISSCAVTPPAEKISGNYTGQYTYNASVTNGVTATVTEVNDNTCNISFSGSGISPLTISNIGITANSNNTSYALTKTGMTESMSGAVDENNQLSVSYSFMSGAMTFVGNK
jgi:hypothetical protein